MIQHLREFVKFGGTARRGLYVLALALPVVACGRDPLEPDPSSGGAPGAGGDEELAQLMVTVSDVPADVGCVSLLIAADKAETRKFDLQPGQPAELNLTRVPTGSVVFTADAFPKRCAEMSTGGVATWTGGPKTVTLHRGANPTVVIVMRPNSQVKVRLEFEPGASHTMCADGGATCTRDSDCCSQQCTASLRKDGKPSDSGKCSQDAPPAPTVPVKTSKDPLEGTGGRAAFPAFDGDTFFVTFPRRPLAAGQVPTADVRRLFVEPALRAVGFERLGQLSNPEMGARTLPGGNFSQLLAAVCQPSSGRENLSNQVCGLLASQNQFERASVFVRRALGQSLDSLQREIGRGLQFWYFVQYEGEVPIEHKAVVALRYGGQQVSSVFGAYLNNYAPTNRVMLGGDAALARGLPHLLQLENLERLATLPGAAPDAGAAPSGPALERPTLVLLPYGTVAGEGGTTLTAVRYAYRGGLAAVRPQKSGPGQQVGYTVWVDAESGQILKFDPDFNDAIVEAQSWCRDPAKDEFGERNLCPVQFDVTDTAMGPRFLENGTFARLAAVGSTPASMELPAAGGLDNASAAENAVCDGLDGSSSEFRQVSTFAQLNRALTLVSAGGYFTGFDNPIKVNIDSTLPSSAVLSTLQLTFSNGERMSFDNCQNIVNSQLNAAQDMTIVSHELAHLATLNLQNVLQTGCRTRCPTTNKKNRQFFHDYSDGYATMMSRSPCIGGWMAKNVSALLSVGETPTDDQAQLAESCMRGFETGLLPRLMIAETDIDPVNDDLYKAGRSFVGQPAGPSPFLQDAFPEHHSLNQGEYADGQIVGAALWTTFRGVLSHSPLIGELALWGRINQGVLASGFTTRTCGNACDDSTIYSAAREFLFHVANGWITSEGNQDVNKLMSAFARAGIFLVPVSCFDGDPATSSTVTAGLPLDAHFCPNGEIAADAIIDFYDGDNRDFDAEEYSGVLLHEDDYARPTDTPYFLVWTGPNFVFNGKVAVQGDRRCNTNYEIEYWPEDPADPSTMFAHSQPHRLPGTVTGCFARVPIPAMPQLGTGAIRYKVRTFTPNAMLPPPGEDHVRHSNQPGFGLWANNNQVTVPASVFYINADGRPELPPVPAPPPP